MRAVEAQSPLAKKHGFFANSFSGAERLHGVGQAEARAAGVDQHGRKLLPCHRAGAEEYAAEAVEAAFFLRHGQTRSLPRDRLRS